MNLVDLIDLIKTIIIAAVFICGLVAGVILLGLAALQK